MYQELLNHLKDQFHEFCGMISIDEIVSNEPLMRVIEQFERMLNAAGPQ